MEYCESQGILVQCYCPLGGGPASGTIRQEDGTALLLQHPEVQAMSSALGRSPAQVCLRWSLQRNCAVVPRSTNPTHISENAALWDFELSDDMMGRLSSLEEDRHFAWNPLETLAPAGVR